MFKRCLTAVLLLASITVLGATNTSNGDGSGIGGTGMKPGGGGIGGTGRSGSGGNMDDVLPERVEIPERIERPELEQIDKPDFEKPDLDGLSPEVDVEPPEAPSGQN